MNPFRKKKKPRRNGNQRTASEGNQPIRTTPVSKTRQKAEAMSRIEMNIPDFAQEMHNIVYTVPLTQVNKDALRLIRRVCLEKRSNGQVTDRILFSEVDELVPEEARGDVNKESLYLFMTFVDHLLDHFESEEIATTYKTKMRELVDNGNFESVKDIIEVIGGDLSRSALVIRCLNQAVAITGHTQIKMKVCPAPTKDLQGPNAWKITVVLAEYVQVVHTKRETCVHQFSHRNDRWELEYDVRLTFEKNMTEMTNSTLVKTDLSIEHIEEPDWEQYLREKFGEGDLVVS